MYSGIRKRKISIISNNCAAGFLYKEFGCKYMTPTINLQISPNDYVKLCKKFDYYLSQEIKEIKNPNIDGFVALGGEKINFPVGILDDLIIYFQHYTDFDYAAKKWEERKKRINYDELFFVLIDTYCNLENVKDFFSIPYENKIFMTGNNDLIINKNCILIDTNKKAWFNSDWMKRFNFRKWFSKGR